MINKQILSMTLSAECDANATLFPPAGSLEGDIGIRADLGNVDTLLGSSDLYFILGRTIKISKDTGRKEKVFLDPLDKDLVNDKLEAFSHAYAKLTTHKIFFEYAKPTSFQKKRLDAQQKRRQ